jgi:hypothetical protein
MERRSPQCRRVCRRNRKKDEYIESFGGQVPRKRPLGRPRRCEESLSMYFKKNVVRR